METLTEILSHKIFLWTGFNLLVLALLALDLGIFHRKDHKISMKESLIWSVIWIIVALLFNVFVYFWKGGTTALEFFTGYFIERSLSIDNLFVFLMVFSYFKVPDRYQYRVLFWGIIGALIFRGLFIAMGTFLVAKFSWILYIFGVFLIYAGLKMAFAGEKEFEPRKNPILRCVRKLVPVTKRFHDGKFFIFRRRRRFATPLFIVLVVVETTDIVFAVDSIPAIFAITLDPFIVYSSNVFAILGLRALYFALAALMYMFYYLKYGLGAILAFVGLKMLIAKFYHMPIWVALTVITGMLTLSVVASLIWPKKEQQTSK